MYLYKTKQDKMLIFWGRREIQQPILQSKASSVISTLSLKFIPTVMQRLPSLKPSCSVALRLDPGLTDSTKPPPETPLSSAGCGTAEFIMLLAEQPPGSSPGCGTL